MGSNHINFTLTNLGEKIWHKNGRYHREDGPAYEHSNGSKWWYLNGKFHREDGPAIEYSNGDKRWYLNGKQYYSFEEFFELTTDEGKEAIIWRMHEYR